MPRPLVTAIIPTYNCTAFLRKAIDSALSQTCSAMEVIVVDDGSTDDTPAVCGSYGDRIRYIRRANGGTPAARNTGLQAAHGEFVALLDHDDQWLPEKIEKQVEMMASDGRIGLVHTGGRVVNLASGAMTSEYLPDAESSYHDLLRWCIVGCATAMMRKSDVDAVGGFDETLSGADDWDMWIRLAWRSRVIGIREVLTEIGIHGENQGQRYKRMYPIVKRVITKERPSHEGCKACDAARRDAARTLRLDYYVKGCGASKGLVRQGKVFKGLAARVDALWKYPEAVSHLPRRLLAKNA